MYLRWPKITINPFIHPKYWGTWVAILICYVLSKLPLSTLQRLGLYVGGLGYRIIKRQRFICRRNIELCFPELSTERQTEMAKQAFNSSATGLLEGMFAWWRDVRTEIKDVEVEGREHLQQKLRHQAQYGRGILLIGSHLTTSELAISLVSFEIEGEFGMVYRPHKNALIDRVMKMGRCRFNKIKMFTRSELRPVARFLKQGNILGMSPDNDFGDHSGNTFVPFFGIDAATISTPTWLVRQTNCQVLQVSCFRLTHGGYKLCFKPFPDGFGQDEVKDAAMLNKGLETEIRRYPAQYFWLQRRFRTRPAGQESLYLGEP